MSTINQTAGPSRSDHNFTAIFQVALTEYEAVTRKSLCTHPFATQLESCDSPQAISNVLLTQAEAFSKFRKHDGRLMACLDPMVNILFTFSATLGEGVGLVSHSFVPYTRPPTSLSAILTRENNIYGDRCTSRGTSLPRFRCRKSV